MEVIKRKILLEDSTDRTYNSPNWGAITADTFYLNVFITQNIDDMGLFTNIDYVQTSNTTYVAPDYQILINKLNLSGYTFPFMSGGTPLSMTGLTSTDEIVLRTTGSTESDYYNFGNLLISGYTDTKIDDVKSYNAINPYRIGFDTAKAPYINYQNINISGVSRVVSMGEPKVYVIDTVDDVLMGTSNQVYGLLYQDYTGSTRNVTIDGASTRIPSTTFSYVGEGINETNISLSALTKEEYLFGIISPPEVQSDVFIDRGITTVMEMHLKLSEVKDLGQLIRYGNGFYNLTRQ